MTTEDDFQAMLDANPDDHTTRRILGDWLDDRGDPRAAGYRALGTLRLRPSYAANAAYPGWWWGATDTGRSYGNVLKSSWYGKLPVIVITAESHPNLPPMLWGCSTINCDTRREADDLAALAYLELTDAQRKYL